MYQVFDFYKNPFGERIFANESYEECVNFCKMYNEECDGECELHIYELKSKMKFEN